MGSGRETEEERSAQDGSLLSLTKEINLTPPTTGADAAMLLEHMLPPELCQGMPRGMPGRSKHILLASA